MPGSEGDSFYMLHGGSSAEASVSRRWRYFVDERVNLVIKFASRISAHNRVSIKEHAPGSGEIATLAILFRKTR